MDQPYAIPPRIPKLAEAALLLVATLFLALHAVHLSADFPNHSPWMDWAKYTDEGWYGDAAIRHFQRGHWHVPGDFNPAAALPVWPLLEAALFRFTGVNLAAARALTVAIFACILLASYLLLRRWQLLSSGKQAETSLAPATWLSYYLLVVRPHFLPDFHYLFEANSYSGLTPSNVLSVVANTIADGLWIGKILYPLALLAAVSVFLLRPRLLRNPLVPS